MHHPKGLANGIPRELGVERAEKPVEAESEEEISEKELMEEVAKALEVVEMEVEAKAWILLHNPTAELGIRCCLVQTRISDPVHSNGTIDTRPHVMWYR